jgi:uncharacterized membrane protein YwaF
MDRRLVTSVAFVAIGIALIVFNKRLGANYIDGYNTTARWLFGPISSWWAHIPWIIGGITFASLGIAVFLGWVH